MLTILPQDVKTWWQVKADDKPSGLVGAFISTTAPNFTIPSGTNLLAGLDFECADIRTQSERDRHDHTDSNHIYGLRPYNDESGYSRQASALDNHNS